MKDQSKRTAARRTFNRIEVVDITTMEPYDDIASTASLVDASSSGFKLHIHRNDLLQPELRRNLTLDSLLGKQLMLRIDLMDLEIFGVVTRTKLVGKGVYELCIDYSNAAPEYWRECLLDMLPSDEDFEDYP